MFTPFVIIIISIVIFIVILNSAIYWIFFGKFKEMKAARLQKVAGDIAGQEIKYSDDTANFFGQESLGITQMRGNGIFRITKEEIYFRMFIPNRVFRFLIKDIKSIEDTQSHLGKTKFTPLLKVIFTGDKGENDSVAWRVDNLSEAQDVIKSFMD